MKGLTPLRAIKKYCLECGNGQPKEVEACCSTECPLYGFRFGKKPKKQEGLGLVVASQTENDEVTYEENISKNSNETLKTKGN